MAAGAALDTGGVSQTIAGLRNAGTVNLAGAVSGSTLTVTGAYVGNGGVLQLGTAPANGGAAGNLSRASNGSSGMPGNLVSIDRLVLNGTAASASGHTTIQITNLSGLGAQMKWRTGCEGRISLLKRRHGLDRCRYKGTDRHEALGRPRRDRRQPHQHRSGP